jgi:cytochrome c-type biogenesis protein CcmF
MLSLAAPSLWVAVVLGAASGLFASSRKDAFIKTAADPLSRALAVGSALALWLPTIALGRALWKLDLSLTYVVDHTRGGVSGWYRLAGLWGGAAGSLLLLATMTSTVLAAMVVFGPVHARRAALATLAVTTVGLAVGLATVAQPFGHLSIPAISGAGLQPILEHPAMLYHPPILYAGLVATVIPFVLVVAGPTGSQPGRLSLRSSLGVAFALLTLGLATGSNWAYVELGWGGFWGWDPVENAVLVPWMLVLAGLHVSLRSGAGRGLAILAGAPWIVVLVGTTVTRVGIGGSVHAFADDSTIGVFLVVVIVACALLLAHSVSKRWSSGHSRGLMKIHAGLALTAAGVTLAGVLWPLPAPGEPLVSGHFYATLLAPVALAAVLGSAVAFVKASPLTWGSAGVAGAVMSALAGGRSAFSLFTGAALAVLVVSLVVGWGGGRPRAAVILGHLGFVMVMIGIAGATEASELTARLEPGESVEIAGFEMRHEGLAVTEGPAPQSQAVVASLVVSDGGRAVTTLRPSLVSFADRARVLPETALHSRPLADIQVVLRLARDDGSATYQIAVRPLTIWVWWGATAIAVAGALSVVGAIRVVAAAERPSRLEEG